MPVILSLDTSGPLCSVALARDGERFVDSRRVDRQHNLHVLGAIDGLCLRAGILPRQLDGIVFIKGPGSFTGVRLAVAVAQALAYGSGARVLGVTSSHALALHAAKQGIPRCVTAICSRGTLWYLSGWVTAKDEASPVHVDQLVAQPPEWLSMYDVLVGDPPSWVPEALALVPADAQPAATLLDYAITHWGQAAWTDAEGALPVYIDGDHPWQPAVAKTE